MIKGFVSVSIKTDLPHIRGFGLVTLPHSVRFDKSYNVFKANVENIKYNILFNYCYLNYKELY